MMLIPVVINETAKLFVSHSTVFSSTQFPVPTAAAIERAKTLKEEGNELVRKGNHKKAIEKYRESLKLNQESSTYTNR